MVYLVRAASLTNYAEIARRSGLDPAALLRKHGMSLKLIADPERRIPILPVMALLEESAQLAGCPSFGLRMAESRQLADLGGISLLLTHQRTLGDALQTLIDHLGLVHPSVAMSLEREAGVAVLRMKLLSGNGVYSAQGEELALGVVWHMCTALLGPQWRPRRVTLMHAAPPDLRVHQRVFGGPVQFLGECNGIILAEPDLELPNPRADPSMLRFARRILDTLPSAGKERSVAAEVRKAIYLMLPAGRATIEQIALGMGCNVRTLQRQLEERHLTFSDLLDEVRGELVLRYIENRGLPLARIATLLGYSTPSSFTRWFSAKFGMAPNEWRKAGVTGSRGRASG